ncbi:universal stress protein [Natronorarus salvus]|uniref:universal stress protein n=1 Tax=Natronorarus salvus TaxID=3117733 RepID=UPI002F2626D3
MAERILVPVTYSEESEKAVEFAVSRFPEAEIRVIHVINPSYHYGTEGYFDYGHIIEAEEKNAEELFERVREVADSHGVEITAETRTGQTPRTIIAYAEDEGVDQIILGSRGRSGISRLLLGSVAEAVTRRSPVPVTVVR